MITELQLKNFKAWTDTGRIRMAPLTVFFGTNSAGKSSLSQSLLLLKQTAESADRQRPLRFGDEHTLVDLGDFESVVHGHDVRRDLHFGLRWALPTPLAFTDASAGARHVVDRIAFDVDIGRQGAGLGVRRFDYRLFGADAAPELRFGLTQQADDARAYELSTSGYHAIRNPERTQALPPPHHFFGFPDEGVAYYQNTSVLSDLNLETQRVLDSLLHVGPLRDKPRRLYRWSGEGATHVGERGDRTIEAFLAGRERMFSFADGEPAQRFDVLLAARLEKMGVIDGFAVEALAEGRKEYEVRVVTRSGAPSVLVTDVGFGVSQVLPVVVECFCVPANAIVLFEQPELHLHPAVQSELADLFLDALEAREDGVRRDVQFIVESHSEHFLRRLQRRIAEERVDPDQVALYFVTGDGDGARIEELALDAFGRISNWPDRFFGDAAGEIEAQMMRTMERMMGEGEA